MFLCQITALYMNMFYIWLVISISSVHSYGVFKRDNVKNCDPYLWDNCTLGPPCTLGAHNYYPECDSQCPGEIQPNSTAPNGSINQHYYYDNFIMDFKVYYVQPLSYPPPYDPATINITYNISMGRTYYDVNYLGGAMRESYYNMCIPIYPEGSLSTTNNYSCDYYTINNNKTAYAVFHDDRPEGAPKCCILANRFHAPVQTFFNLLPVKSQTMTENILIDWASAELISMGNVTYGFNHDYKKIDGKSYSIPFAFFFQGIPWIDNWCYQRFMNFDPIKPDKSVWKLPQDCLEDDVTWCPGWDPWIIDTCDN